MRRTVTAHSVLAAVVVLALSMSAMQAQDVFTAQRSRPGEIPDFLGYAPDRIVLKLDAGLAGRLNKVSMVQGRFGIPELDNLAERLKVSAIRQQFPGAPKKMLGSRVIDLSGWHVVNFADQPDIAAVVDLFRTVGGVLDVQPVGIHVVHKTPNDPRFQGQWHLNHPSNHDINAPEAWDFETGKQDVLVAILDSGVRYMHKDLGGADASWSSPQNANGNMWINQAEKNGQAGVDDDNNGFVDDWIGWDFVASASSSFLYSCFSGEDCNTADNDPRDFNGHGTHTSGIVAAINNNGYGVASTAGGWENGSQHTAGNGVKVMGLRIGWSARYLLGGEVGLISMEYAAQAFRYAADNGAKIASCSWGSSNSGGIAEAIDYFLASGGLIFKSAGNNNNENTDYMTARTDIISVAATDSNDVRASFSSYGTWVDISAPGDYIWSTYHDHANTGNDYVAAMSGTSMASPMAASVAALIWSQNPGWTASQVKQRLFETADQIDNLPGNASYVGKLGAGRINAYRAVNSGGGPGAPVAAFAGSPVSGCAALTVNFTDQSTGEVSSWSWTFGDGGTSNDQNPTHIYTAAGTYQVALTVTGPGGSDTETKANYITVSTTPAAEFSASPVSGNAPLTVAFTDQSTGNPTSWSWDFGDGATSTTRNPSHQYTAAGTYTVSLTASSTCGSSTVTKQNLITVSQAPANAMHIASITVTKQIQFGFRYRGKAVVKIVDAGGNPVSSATVAGTWSGGATDSDQFTTGSNGEGTAYSNYRTGNAEFTFCVNNVTKTSWTYDTGANVVTCGSTTGTQAVQGAGVDDTEAAADLDVAVVLENSAVNYPNPFNPSTTISFMLPADAQVRVEIYDLLGRRVAQLVDERLSAGVNSVRWEGVDDAGRPVGSGQYLYRITTSAGTTIVRKIMLLK